MQPIILVQITKVNHFSELEKQLSELPIAGAGIFRHRGGIPHYLWPRLLAIHQNSCSFYQNIKWWSGSQSLGKDYVSQHPLPSGTVMWQVLDNETWPDMMYVTPGPNLSRFVLTMDALQLSLRAGKVTRWKKSEFLNQYLKANYLPTRNIHICCVSNI